MLEKTLIKSILKKWDYGDFRVIFWDKEEFLSETNLLNFL